MHSDSVSIALLSRNPLSMILCASTAIGDGLQKRIRLDFERLDDSAAVIRQHFLVCCKTLIIFSYLPASQVGFAIGENSTLKLKNPSVGLSGHGSTTSALTAAYALS
jgi:hypothetical protein